MELVVDWNSVCLVCLQEGEMISIYERDKENNLTISDKIMKCSNIEIQKGMNLPEQICNKCYEDLKVAYKFRENCESSNLILKSFVKMNSNIVDANSSSNEQTSNFKPPGGLTVKRIKVAPRFFMKEVQEYNDDDDDEFILTDNIEYTDEDNVTIKTNASEDSCESIIYVSENENKKYFNNEGNKEKGDFEICLTSSQKEKKIKDVKDRTIKNIDKATKVMILEENNDVKIDTKQLKTRQVKGNKRNQSNRKKMATTSKAMKTAAIKRKRGRPKTRMIKSDVNITPDNVSNMVSQLTTVAYVEKKKKEEKPLKICEICGNGYKYQHALDSHMRRHRNERPFACEFCDRAFVANVELRRHMRVHTGQKPYACHYCTRCFSDFGSRIKHERTHTGERPYECSTCGKTFAYAHVLSVHVLTHTGEKKFKCEICGRGFTKKLYLQGHMKHHMDEQTFIKEREDKNENLEIIHEIQILPDQMDDEIETKIEYVEVFD